MNAVQIKNPITGNWLKVSTITGRIIGERRKPYAVPKFPPNQAGQPEREPSEVACLK